VYATRKKRPRSQHDGSTAKFDPKLGHHSRHPITFQEDVVDGLLKHKEIALPLYSTPDRLPVEDSIRLRPRCPDRWALGRIQDPELNPSFVRRKSHGPAKGVDFLNQMALSNASD